MCGIVSVISNEGNAVEKVVNARATMKLRGPDGNGIWSVGNVAIGHARLAVTGGEAGHQPIISNDSQIIISVNGEFYDYKAIRSQLADFYDFKTDSDSEILIPLYLKYGYLGMMNFLRGEFAFVLYDARKKLLVAVRDRFGIKPLCWYCSETEFVVASKAKAIFAAGIEPKWDNESLIQAVTMQYQNTEKTFFDRVNQLAPGHILLFLDNHIETIKYWDIDYSIDDQYGEVSAVREMEYIEEFARLVRESVRLRVCGDSPTCFHLSGGLDSSAVLGVAMDVCSTPQHCFSVVFPDVDEEYDETRLAEETSSYCNAMMHKIPVRQNDIVKHLPDAVYQSEGLAVNGHLSCKYLLNREINKSGFKVALTGEGADECLAGYSHLRSDLFASLPTDKRKQFYEKLSRQNRFLIGTEIPDNQMLDSMSIRKLLGFTPSFVAAKAGIGYKMYKLLSDDFRQECIRLNVFSNVADYFKGNGINNIPCKVNKSLYMWNKLTLCNYILGVLGDGCEMAWSVEGRFPFLDHKLFEFAAKLPLQMKIKGYNNEKYILKQAAKPFITRNVYQRHKHSFQAPPLTRFFSQENFDAICGWILSSDFLQKGWFSPKELRKLLMQIKTADVTFQTAYEPVVMLLVTISCLDKCFMNR